MFNFENFSESTEWFFTESSKIEDGWSLEYNDIDNSNYLRKKSHIYKKEKSHSTTQNDDDDDEIISADDDYLICEHHFLYSTSYSIPVVFFNIHTKEGGLLVLEDVWSLIKEKCPLMNNMKENQFWSFVTQQVNFSPSNFNQEHPVLNRPFFTLHPCHSDHFMAQISKQHTSPKQYLLAWITSIAPYVLLELPISYANLCNQL